MSESVKQVILRDPKTNEILIPKIIGTLGYEPDEDGTLIPPYTNDADTLGGKTADQFAAAEHNHDDKYAATNHDHSGVYATPEQLNEVKTSVAEGKALVAAAVSDKGVETAADAEFATIAANIAGIKTGIQVNGSIVSSKVASGNSVTEGDFVKLLTDISNTGYKQQTYYSSYGTLTSFMYWLKDNWYLIVYHGTARLIQIVNGVPQNKASCNTSTGNGALMQYFLVSHNTDMTNLFFLVKGNYGNYAGVYVKLTINYSTPSISSSELSNSAKYYADRKFYIPEDNCYIVSEQRQNDDSYQYSLTTRYNVDSTHSSYHYGLETYPNPTVGDNRQYSATMVDAYKDPDVENGYIAKWLYYPDQNSFNQISFFLYTVKFTVSSTNSYTKTSETNQSLTLPGMASYTKYFFNLGNHKVAMICMSHQNNTPWPVYIFDTVADTFTLSEVGQMPYVGETVYGSPTIVYNTYNNETIISFMVSADLTYIIKLFTNDGTSVEFQTIATISSTTDYSASLRGYIAYGEYGYLLPLTSLTNTNYTDWRMLNPGIIKAVGGEPPTGIALQSGNAGNNIQIAIP